MYDKNCIYANLFIFLAEIIEYYYFYAQIVRLCLHKNGLLALKSVGT